MGSELSGKGDGLKYELAVIRDLNDDSGGKLLDRASVNNGESLELRLSNVSAEKMWVTLVFLDSNMLIKVMDTVQLHRLGEVGSEMEPFRFTVAAKKSGPQCWLLIASSAENDNSKPDFEFLNQPGIQQAPEKSSTAQRAQKLGQPL